MHNRETVSAGREKDSASPVPGAPEPVGLPESGDATRSVATPAVLPTEDTVLERGTAVGRYLVTETLGEGGMGRVYAAVDPELGRKVALKLVSAEHGASLAPESQARLMREAQAMAQLSHPNVVTVHDVGLFQGRVFVAMELVEGGTLKGWLKAGPRSWQEVRKVFLQAGQGLWAAHQAGLVHRDFKPDNVLLGKDGRARVTDFGLARASGRDESQGDAPPKQVPSGRESTLLELQLTRRGISIGTPAYMAPEQHLGKALDPRTDQFSFCISLYLALFGQRPFEGETAADLRQSVLAGKVRPIPRDTPVPAWLTRVVLRGLNLEPEQRYPSMQALLEALAADPGIRRRRWLGAGALTLLAAGIALGVGYRQRQQQRLCSGGPSKLAGTWDAEVQQKIESAFLATKRAHAAQTWSLVRTRLDGLATRWTAMETEACEAALLRREQSEETLRRRRECLDQRRHAFSSLTGLLAHADASVVDRATQAANGLDDVDACADLDALMRTRPPTEPAVRAKVEALSAQVSELKPLHLLGKLPQLLERTYKLRPDVTATGYLPLRGELAYWEGSAYQRVNKLKDAKQVTLDSLYAAEESRHDELLIRAAVLLAEIARLDGRNDEGLMFARLGQAAADRIGASDLLRGELARVRSSLLFEQNVGEAILSLEEAIRLHQRGGATSDVVAGDYNGLAYAQLLLKNYDQARELNLRATQLNEEALGPDHWRLGILLGNLADISFRQGRYQEALDVSQKALAHLERTLGPNSPHALLIIATAAAGLNELGRPAEAIALAEPALALSERDAPESTLTSSLALALGEAHLATGNISTALPLFERQVLVARKSERAKAIRFPALFGLARALWDSGGPQRGRAWDLAREAQELVTKDGSEPKQARAVETWLAAHPKPRSSARAP